MKKIALIFIATALWIAAVRADEGMWLPMFVQRLNHAEMQKMGLKLSPEEIYNVNNASLKDAIVGLSNSPTPNGFFCTGEIVSAQGLVFTNHHCAYDLIQKHSTVENDYLTNGFWAMTAEEELPNEGLTASVLVSMADVTDSVMAVLDGGMSASERNAAIRKKTSELRKSFNPDGNYHVVVKSFFEGNAFYLFIYQVYRDVRLVGAPPSAIGKFGGDTDNWMWPRHTGDFAVLRIYTAPDGSPADYSKDNIPLKPKYHLPISLDGLQNSDFTMIWGFPGSTDRYLTSFGVNFNLEKQYPIIIDLLGKKLESWKQFMDADAAVRIQYASQYAQVANTWKYLIGQTRGLRRLDIMGRKQAQEMQFAEWFSSDDELKARYGEVLPTLEAGYLEMGQTIAPLLYNNFAGVGGAELIGYASSFGQLRDLLGPIPKNELPKDKAMAEKMRKERREQLEKTIQNLREGIAGQFKDYHAPADQLVLQRMLEAYDKQVSPEDQPEAFRQLMKRHQGNYAAAAAWVFAQSAMSNPEKVEALLNKPNLKALQNDPALQLADGFSARMMEFSGAFRQAQSKVSDARRLWMAGLREMQPQRAFYPDANSTLRFTYGSVKDYFPADAVHYNYITTHNGILEKEDPTNEEFVVPEKLKKLIQTLDFGPYGKNDTLVTCFISTNDITGGNSGSPVINGKGELVGIAFDGNWEAMSGDIAFEPELQRTISVDIRYVLFVIDRYAGATRLIDELDIRKADPAPLRIEMY